MLNELAQTRSLWAFAALKGGNGIKGFASKTNKLLTKNYKLPMRSTPPGLLAGVGSIRPKGDTLTQHAARAQAPRRLNKKTGGNDNGRSGLAKIRA